MLRHWRLFALSMNHPIIPSKSTGYPCQSIHRNLETSLGMEFPLRSLSHDGSMVLLYMVTWIPSIWPHLLAYIPAPWILWVWNHNEMIMNIHEFSPSPICAGPISAHGQFGQKPPRSRGQMEGQFWCPLVGFFCDILVGYVVPYGKLT